MALVVKSVSLALYDLDLVAATLEPGRANRIMAMVQDAIAVLFEAVARLLDARMLHGACLRVPAWQEARLRQGLWARQRTPVR